MQQAKVPLSEPDAHEEWKYAAAVERRYRQEIESEEEEIQGEEHAEERCDMHPNGAAVGIRQMHERDPLRRCEDLQCDARPNDQACQHHQQ